MMKSDSGSKLVQMKPRMILIASAVAAAGLALMYSLNSSGSSGTGISEVPRWDLLAIGGNEVERYDDLRTMTTNADVVLVGTVEAVTSGRTFGNEANGWAFYATLEVRPDEVLHGTPVVEDGAVRVEVFLGDENDYSDLAESLPGEEAVFFLRDKGLEAAALGLPKSDQQEQSGLYRWVSSQGLLVNARGKVNIPLYSDESGFPTGLRGRPFLQVSDETRAHGRRP